MLIHFLLSALDTPLTSHSCLLTRTPWFTPVLFYNTGKAFWRVFWLVSLMSKSERWLSTPVCLLRRTLLGWDISVYTESLNIRTHYHSFMGVAGATLIRGRLPHHFIWLKKNDTSASFVFCAGYRGEPQSRLEVFLPVAGAAAGAGSAATLQNPWGKPPHTHTPHRSLHLLLLCLLPLQDTSGQRGWPGILPQKLTKPITKGCRSHWP